MVDKSLFFISIIVIMIALSLSISNVYAIPANSTDFSVNVLNNWAYRLDVNNPLANALVKGLGVGSTLTLIPIEFSDVLVNTSKDIAVDAIENGGAYSLM